MQIPSYKIVMYAQIQLRNDGVYYHMLHEVSSYEPKGRGFESLPARQKPCNDAVFEVFLVLQ